MHPFKFLSLVGLCLLPYLLPAQSYTVSGYVRAAATGEDLIAASVYAPEQGRGVYSNDYGFYSLTLQGGDTVEVQYRYAGFAQRTERFYLDQNTTLNVTLDDAQTTTDEVVISGEASYSEQVNSPQMSVASVNIEEARTIPALFGEVDIIKVLQLKPGVQSGGEGTSGLFVRGGGPDQNLIVLDEALVYNANHLFGLFSTFNPDAVRDVQLYKGGFPAQFGGRLSSVVDVRLKEGNREEFSARGGIGTISSRLTVESPFDEGKGSFMLAGRRTYFDIITRAINRANSDNENFTPIPDYYFYDLNTKVNYTVGENDRIFLSGYFGKDVFGFNGDFFNFNFNWGNITSTARWNHLFSPKLFLNTTFTFSDYDYTLGGDIANNSFNFEAGSRIQDYNLKTDFFYQPDDRHTIKFGASATYHRFQVNRSEFSTSDSALSVEAGDNLYAREYGIYIGDEFVVDSRLTLYGGLRVSAFDNNDDSFYWGLEPRASFKYSLTDKLSVKGSYARMFQYVHLISNSGASLPTDVWYPSTERVRPQDAQQVATGMALEIGDGTFLLTNEYYYKWLNNQVDFKDNANLFVNDGLEDQFLFGRGYTYGTEVYLEKRRGNLTGWIGYTLSWAWRVFDGSLMTPEGETVNPLAVINNGDPFHPTYDRRHDITAVLMQKFGRRWTATATFVYGTGNAFSLPTGRSFAVDPFSGDVNVVPLFEGRNQQRLPDYHRLDVGLVYKMFPKWGEADFTFGVYNAYNRRNAFFAFIETDFEAQRFAARQVALFPIIPSITFNFKY